MDRALVIAFLVAATLAVSTQAAVKDIPPLFRENPNLRSIVIDPRADESAQNYRLPNNTEPHRYEVHLTTDVHKGDYAFTGVVKITLNVTEDTKTIVLHKRQLTINSANIQRVGTTTSIGLSHSYETVREFLTLTPTDTSVTFPKDTQWVLSINYNGTLRRDNGGFYMSTYLDEQQQTRYLATTQFESTDARHGFPCYDEPAKRAIFSITINHDPSYTAISNMPVADETVSGGRKTTVFHDTASMPSYLVAFIVSDFKYSEGVLNNLPQRVYSRPGSEHDQEWALVSGMLIAERLASYYNVKYNMPKLDQVAVPDFAAGAMENWGLATYREEYMLYNKDTSTVNTQTNIANIIAHEYCHQWFGNLVAIKWWAYLWLKEGFATMFSYKSTDEAYPEWGIMQMFHMDDYLRALSADAGTTAAPMTYYVQTPNEISYRYDSISYSKAGSVLFMWQYALTDKIFQRGLHNYLVNNQFSAAEEDDLFEAIQTAAKEENVKLADTVKNMMSSWTRQTGYPLLTVERFYNGSFQVTQTPFFDNATYQLDHDKTWYVPINYAVKSNADFRNTKATHYLLNVKSIAVHDNISNSDWLILNKQSTGFYRINYDTQNWNLIIDGLISKSHKIDPRNRAQLMQDAYTFSSTNRLSHSILLSMMTYLKNEDQYAPWSTANSILSLFNRYLSGDSSYNDFKFYVSELVGNIYEKVGVNDIPGEQHFQKYIRSIAINLACMAGIESCLQETNNKLKGLINENIPIEPNLQSQTYCNGLKQSDDKEFNFVFDQLMNSQDQAQRRVMISSLGCAHNANHLKKFVESSIDKENKLRSQERTTLLSSAYSRGEAGLMASIDFLNENWQQYAELTGTFGGANPLDSDIIGMASYVTNSNQQAKLLALCNTVKSSNYVRANLEDVVNSRINANFVWLENNRDHLINWMTVYRTGGSSSLSASFTAVAAAFAVIVMRML